MKQRSSGVYDDEISPYETSHPAGSNHFLLSEHLNSFQEFQSQNQSHGAPHVPRDFNQSVISPQHNWEYPSGINPPSINS
jgi:hypothetical protein